MELNLVHIIVLVVSCVLIQFVFKWTVGNKINSKEDMLSQSRKDYHMLRRLQHISTGLVMLFFWRFSPREYNLIAIFVGAFGFFIMNLYRVYNPKFNEKYIQNFGFLLRPHEINNMPGAFYFLVGLFFAGGLYGRIEAYMAYIILSFGDPFASLCGIYFKSPKLTKDKTIAGTLGCGLVCVVISLAFYYLNADFNNVREEIKPLEWAAVTMVIAVLAELGPSSRKIHFEDNTSIPVYSGLLFTAYFNYIHQVQILNK